MSWPRGAACGVAVITALVVAADVAAVMPAGPASSRVYVAISSCLVVATAALGVLVAWRRSGAVGPLLCGLSLATAVVIFSDSYVPARELRPSLPELPSTVVAVLVVGWVWLYVVMAMVMLVFPDGRLVARGRRWAAAGLMAVALSIHVAMVMSPGAYDAPYAAVGHPFGDLPEPVALGAKVVLFPALVALLAVAVGSLWRRYRRGEERLRSQLKWFVLPGLALLATQAMSWIGFLVSGTHDLAGIGLAVGIAGITGATTISVLRYDLYDVDRAVSAAVMYSIATAVLLLVFTIVSVAAGVLVGGDSVTVAAVVTAAMALLLVPLRIRLQRQVDRRVYPLRAAAKTAIETLRARTSTGVGRPEQLEEVLRTALADPALRFGFVVPGAAGFLDASGEPIDAGYNGTPVVLDGRQIGVIHSHGPATSQLLREVANASALLVEVCRLRLQVSAALRDVESSRTRLLRIGYEERRRLERDLHDGTQQRLVSLGLSLRLAQRHLPTVDVNGLLDQSVAELATAVAELRQVSQGLRPSCLDDGLRPALTVLAESVPLPIDLEIGADQAVPDEIATTAYYVVSEAITNAVKHADAGRLRLRILHDEGQLRVRVQDDGRGGAAVRPGSGLAGLCDRVAACGGSLRVTSPNGQGTIVEALLPCAS